MRERYLFKPLEQTDASAEREESPDLLALAGKQPGAKGRPPLPSPNFSAISGNTGNSAIANGMGQLASRVTTFTMADDHTQPVFVALKQFPAVLAVTLVRIQGLVAIESCLGVTRAVVPQLRLLVCWSVGMVCWLPWQEEQIKTTLTEQFVFAKHLSKSLQVEEALVHKTLEKLMATGVNCTACEITRPHTHVQLVRLDTDRVILVMGPY